MPAGLLEAILTALGALLQAAVAAGASKADLQSLLDTASADAVDAEVDVLEAAKLAAGKLPPPA
jgi:hypothetical protein